MNSSQVGGVVLLVLVVGVGATLAAPAQPPEITDSSPSDDRALELALSDDETFSVTVSDPDTDPEDLTVNWYVDDRLERSGSTQFFFDADTYDHGDHTVLVVVSDENGETDRRTWSVEVRHPPEITGYDPARNRTTTNIADSVRFDVTARDPDSTLTEESIVWTVDGQREAIGDSLRLFTDEYRPGTHTVRVRVTDGDSLTDSASREWTLDILQPPSIHDRDPQSDDVTIPEGETRTLSVAASDPDTPDDDLSYRWYVDGQQVGFDRQFTFDGTRYGPGTYTVEARVSDYTGVTRDALEEWTVSVNAIPDITVQQPSGDVVRPGKPIEFQADVSSNGNGDVEDVAWQIGDRTRQGRSAVVSFDEEREVPVTVSVDTESGVDAETSFTLRVIDIPPLYSELQPGSTTIEAGETVTLYGQGADRGTRDLDFEYSWEVDGTEYVGQTTTIGPLRRIGRHTVTATVTNEFGSNYSTTFDVIVENDKPRVMLREASRTVTSSEEVQFEAVVVNDDTTPVSVQYFADNRTTPFYRTVVSNTTNGTSVVGTHSFSTPGRHTVTARVADGHGTQTEKTWLVNTGNRPPQFETAVPDREDVTVRSGTTLPFSVEATDPEGTAIEYRWYVDDSPVGTGPTYQFSANQSGQYTVSAVAVDADGGRAVDDWTVAASRFATDLGVTNQSTQTTLQPGQGETALLTLTVQNPQSNDRTARVEFVLEPVDGMLVTQARNVREASTSSVVSYGTVDPGEQERMGVGVTVDQDLYGKQVSVPYTIRYYPVANPDDVYTVRNSSLALDIGTPGDSNTGGQSTDATGPPGGSGPGFTVALALASLFVFAALQRYRRR
ncbi:MULTISPECIES: PKD domain-containing protein [Salinibaculum]|uniref:PKD domain-containing protein n=1 Tax=Salinibaculum TaxID=2732368 RepID=UPI0030CBD9E6